MVSNRSGGVEEGSNGSSNYSIQICSNCGEDNGCKPDYEITKCKVCKSTCYGSVNQVKLLKRIYARTA